MPVIKSDSAVRITHDAIVLDLGDLRAQGQRILAEAQKQADQVIAKGEAEARRLTAAADAKGFAQGEARGLAEGREQGRTEARVEALEEYKQGLETLTSVWTTAIEHWERDRTAMLVEAKEDVLSFAYEVARKIVLRTIEHAPAVVVDQVAEALALLAQPTSVSIAINPEDRVMVDEALPQIVERIAQCTHATMIDDPTIERGGCIVRTAGGEIDASIATQLNRIAATMLPEDRRQFLDEEMDAAS